MDAFRLRVFDVKLVIVAFGVGGNIYRQRMEDMRQLDISTAVITKLCESYDFEGHPSAFCHLRNQHHYSMQNSRL